MISSHILSPWWIISCSFWYRCLLASFILAFSSYSRGSWFWGDCWFWFVPERATVVMSSSKKYSTKCYGFYITFAFYSYMLSTILICSSKKSTLESVFCSSFWLEVKEWSHLIIIYNETWIPTLSHDRRLLLRLPVLHCRSSLRSRRDISQRPQSSLQWSHHCVGLLFILDWCH